MRQTKKKIKGGGPSEIAPVQERTACDEFENAIRKFGVVNACEWFGHQDGDFVPETIRILIERSKEQS